MHLRTPLRSLILLTSILCLSACADNSSEDPGDRTPLTSAGSVDSGIDSAKPSPNVRTGLAAGQTSRCAPGKRQCNGNAVQTCSASGRWGNPAACSNQVCSNGVCTGVCAPGSTRCSGNAVQTCNSSGQWASSVACSNQVCSNGVCVSSP